MVKTVKFLALSLLMPSLVLAGWMPTTRDAVHAAAGAGEAYVQDTLNHKSKGLALASDAKKITDHAQSVFWGYVTNDAPNAIAYGTVHNQFVGPAINSNLLGQDAQVTLRDNTYRTIGNLAMHLYKGKNWQQNVLTSVNPLFAWAAAKYVWANRTSLTTIVQSDVAAAAQAAQAAYNNNAAAATKKAAVKK